MASAIVMVYVRLIRAGVKTIEDVPERIREEVRRIIEGDAYVPPEPELEQEQEQEQEPQPDSEPESEQEPETQEDGEDEGVDGADIESDA